MESSKINVRSWFITMALAMLSMFSTTSAHAADGCRFLLCIAGPWSSIAECRPTVYEVFHDLARGRPFPTCDMSGSGNGANNIWTSEASCPSMYRQYNPESGAYAGCTYPGRIAVYINGGLWSQVYWNMSGNTSTWYSDAARSGLTQQPESTPLDDTFLRDLTGWNSGQVSRCQSGGGTAAFDAFGALQRCTYPDSAGGGG
jgi:hypothetical protein